MTGHDPDPDGWPFDGNPEADRQATLALAHRLDR